MARKANRRQTFLVLMVSILLVASSPSLMASAQSPYSRVQDEAMCEMATAFGATKAGVPGKDLIFSLFFPPYSLLFEH